MCFSWQAFLNLFRDPDWIDFENSQHDQYAVFADDDIDSITVRTAQDREKNRQESWYEDNIDLSMLSARASLLPLTISQLVESDSIYYQPGPTFVPTLMGHHWPIQ